MFVTSPFEGLQEHAEKVIECALAFQQAFECHVSDQCKRFEELREEIGVLESNADAVKRRIRGHIPIRTLMQVDKFQLFRFLGEQDKVLDSMEETLNWLSFRSEPGIPKDLEKDFLKLIDAVIAPVGALSPMLAQAIHYFRNYSDKERESVKEIIHKLRQQEHEADQVEDLIKQKTFNQQTDPITIFHMIRLAEIIGSIADHAQNAGDMMRAMLAK
jgi:hypothetical protein